MVEGKRPYEAQQPANLLAMVPIPAEVLQDKKASLIMLTSSCRARRGFIFEV